MKVQRSLVPSAQQGTAQVYSFHNALGVTDLGSEWVNHTTVAMATRYHT
jgi:hypothetical protein